VRRRLHQINLNVNNLEAPCPLPSQVSPTIALDIASVESISKVGAGAHAVVVTVRANLEVNAGRVLSDVVPHYRTLWVS
jgi:hypothetical protein